MSPRNLGPRKGVRLPLARRRLARGTSLLLIGAAGALAGCGDESERERAANTTGTAPPEQPPEVGTTTGTTPAERPTRPRRVNPAPPTPKITAQRKGGRALIKYDFTRFPQGSERRPVVILLTVDPPGRREPPLTIQHRLRGPRGQQLHPLPLGPGSYVVYASALSRTGGRSRLISLRLP